MFGFGHWKRFANELEGAYIRLAVEHGAERERADVATRERNAARDEARRLCGQLSGVDLQLAAERQDNESLRRRLKTVQAGLDHATRCYKQAELDRQALLRERDDARLKASEWGESNAELLNRIEELKEERDRIKRAHTIAIRDLERIHLISFEHVTEGTFATPELMEPASAGHDHADESAEAHGPDPDPDPADERGFRETPIGGFASVRVHTGARDERASREVPICGFPSVRLHIRSDESDPLHPDGP